MAISEENKRYLITISKSEYAELEKIAALENRSVSKQSLSFIQDGIKKYKLEGKRD